MFVDIVTRVVVKVAMIVIKSLERESTITGRVDKI
jgi:hypothetical protein